MRQRWSPWRRGQLLEQCYRNADLLSDHSLRLHRSRRQSRTRAIVTRKTINTPWLHCRRKTSPATHHDHHHASPGPLPVVQQRQSRHSAGTGTASGRCYLMLRLWHTQCAAGVDNIIRSRRTYHWHFAPRARTTACQRRAGGMRRWDLPSTAEANAKSVNPPCRRPARRRPHLITTTSTDSGVLSLGARRAAGRRDIMMSPSIFS